MSQDRRSFFRMVGAATVVAAGLTSMAPLRRTAEAAATPATTTWLELDGVFVGLVKAATGGTATAEVVETIRPGGVVEKHLGPITYPAIVLTCGTTMERPFYKWIADTLAGNHRLLNGALVTGNLFGTSRLEFFDAGIDKVVFPGLDLSSRDPISLEVAITPKMVRRTAGPRFQPSLFTGRRWLALSYGLAIGGHRIVADRIEPIIAEAVFADENAGAGRTPTTFLAVNPGHLVVRVPEAHAQTLVDWHHSFVERGQNQSGHEKEGILDYYPEDPKLLFTLKLFNLGVFALTEEVAAKKRWLWAEMYCERMEFSQSTRLT